MNTLTKLRTLFMPAALAASLSSSLWSQTATPPEAKGIVTLEPFTVVSSADSGYRMDSATVASRSNKALIDIPQTVNVLTAEFLSDTFSFTQDDALKYISNTAVRNASIAGIDAGVYIMRGFENQSTYVDGVALLSNRRDMVGYDRMEVIKGVPSAVLGRADASGAINYVLKKPVAERRFQKLRGIVGSNDLYRFEADLNQPITKEVSARLVVAAESSDTFVMDPNDQHLYRVYPSLRITPSDKTEVLFNGEFLRTQSMISAYGQGFTIMPAKFRRLFPDTIGKATDPITAINLPWGFYLSPSEVEEDVANVLTTVTHRFNEHVDFRQIFTYSATKAREEFYNGASNLLETNPYDPTNTNGYYKALLYDLYNREGWRWSAVGDLLLRYGWERTPLDLKFATMIGYSVSSSKQENRTNRFPILGEARYLNLANPRFSPVGENAPIDRVNYSRLSDTLSEVQNVSYYLQQELSAWKDRVMLVYGWRDNRSSGTLVNFLNTANPRAETGNHPPASVRYGMSFRVREKLSLFASHSTQKDPASTTLVWGRLNAGDPRALETIVSNPSTKSTEFGVKGNLFSNRIYFSLAYFELMRTGTIDNESINVESTAGSGQTVLATRRMLTDGDTSRGWEVEVIGEITKRLTVLASGSINDTSQPDPTTVEAGDTRPVRYVPDWSANLFLKYSFSDGRKDGFSVRAGTNIIGPIPASEVSNFGRQPLDKIQQRLDVGASYAWANNRYKLDLQVNNLLNDTFFIVRVNPPREYRLSFSASF